MQISTTYERGQRPPSWKRFLLLLTGLFFSAAALLAIPFLQKSILTWLHGPGTPQVSIQGPLVVDTGSQFEWIITLVNPGEQDLPVEGIRLPHELFKAVTVLAFSPGSPQPVSSAEWTSLPLGFTLAPGESRSVVLTMIAHQALDLSGRLQVMVAGEPVEAGAHLLIQQPAPSPTPTPTQTPTPIPTATPTLVPTPTVPAHLSLPLASVVKITAQEKKGDQVITNTIYGSGSIVSGTGLVLTNAHIARPGGKDVDYLLISLTRRSEQLPEPAYYAEIAAIDEGIDLAVLRIIEDANHNRVDPDALDLPAVPLGNSDELELGDTINILGYPGIGGGTITLTRGEVSGFTGSGNLGNRAYIKTSATTAGGNSGGLAMNEDGELVGIPTQTGYGGDDLYVDCRRLADTNGDGRITKSDTCVPTGGFINALRPVNLALPLIEQAQR